jgi:hypothetical protein
MPRPYPRRRRRRHRPGRRPPNRLNRAYREGYTGYGFGTYYSLLLPGLRGAEKRQFFNRACLWLILGFALGGAFVGFGLAGPLGGLLGFGAAIAAGTSLAEKGRFYRA